MKTIVKKLGLVSIVLSIVLLNAGDPRKLVTEWDDSGAKIVEIIAMGKDGTYKATVNSSKDGFDKPRKVVDEFGKDQGWDSAKHLRLISVYNGIFGFKNKKVISSPSDFSSMHEINGFGYDQGWRRDKHLRLQMGTAGSLLWGFKDAGVYMPKEDTASLILGDFGYNQGWRNDKHIRVISEVNEDSAMDIIGFFDDGVHVSTGIKDQNWTTVGFEKPKLWINDFGYDQGWRNDKHIRLLAGIGSINGLSIVGFGNEGVYTSKIKDTLDGFEPKNKVLDDFGYNQGWRNSKHLRFMADVTKDYVSDIVGFKDKGVYVSKHLGDGSFAAPELWLEDFGYNQGWRNDKHIRLLYDVNDDSYADIVGFFNDGVWVALNNNGVSFNKPTKWLDKFGYDQGWRVEPVQQAQQLPSDIPKPDDSSFYVIPIPGGKAVIIYL